MPAIPYIAMGVTAAGGVMSSNNTAASGEAEKIANEANARVIEMNAAKAEAKNRLENKRILSTQRALYAKAGVDLTSGSPLLIMSESAAEAEREAMDIRYSGKREARLMRYYGRQAKSASDSQAGATLLTTLGNLANQYYSWKTANA
jgi:hypothetical protein